MSAMPVLPEDVVIKVLRLNGFKPTGQKTNTGSIWENREGRYLLVPNSVEGFYPNSLLEIVEKVIGRINPWGHVRSYNPNEN